MVSLERLRHNFFAAFYLFMAQPGEYKRIALSSENGVQDPQSAQAGDLGQHAVDLQVHLVERLLDVHDVLSCHPHQAAAMAPTSSHSANRARWTEARAQQANRMQILEPLAVGDVSPASGHVLHVLRVDQADIETASLEDLIDRNPVDTR
jgi:hypothetical protein